ncbi:polysaccharide biosynthesis/export family protein [Zavarzinella formosa]|uniref:polysaccharide biosynthesis/export family protein n=1 Tax=Zavarzinella formosa TaxID=360055 RepID=UPI0003791AC8|nr:SLBB domain-containing protein [Zavarzinella formosa]
MACLSSTRCLLLAGAIANLAGCGGTGGSVSLSPERFPLGEVAEANVQCGPADLPREPAKAWLERYIVEPGDGLLVMPVELDSKVRIPADQTVLPDGTIDLGKYGRLVAAGKTVPEIELDVLTLVTKKEREGKDKDGKIKDPADKDDPIGSIDVRLVNRQSKVFYVFGEVTTPGRFQLTGNECVLDAILLAGGLTDRSSWQNILLVRPTGDGPGMVLKVNYGDIVRVGAGMTNYQIQPGDRIYVASRSTLDMLLNCDRFR